MVEAEGIVAVDEAVIAEQPACRIADQDIGIFAGGLDFILGEHLAGAPEQRTAAGNAHIAFARLPCPRSRSG